MPAPIIRKIPGLEKRIVGLTPGISNPQGINLFQNGTHQNIHQNLQDGVGGLQIGYDFKVSTSDISSIELANTNNDTDYGTNSTINNATTVTWTATSGTELGIIVPSGDLVVGAQYLVKATVSNYVAGNGGDDIGFATAAVGTTARRDDDGEISHQFVLSSLSSISVFCRDGASGTLSNISVRKVTLPEDKNDGKQNLAKLFDGNDTTSVTIKHNEKTQWIVFDLGKKRNLNRIVIENGPMPGGGTNASKTLNSSFWFWSDGNPKTDIKEVVYSTPDIKHQGGTSDYTNASNGIGTQRGDKITLDLSGNKTKYQYIGMRIWSAELASNYNDGYLNFKNFEIYESHDTRDYIVEFNDSVLDMHSWTGLRYNGCKTTNKEINKYNSRSIGAEGIGNLQIENNFIVDKYFSIDPWRGDITYGQYPNVENRTTALYITSTIIGGTEEEDVYARIKNHSYLKIEKILIINLNDDTVKILDSQTEDFTSYHRYLTTDFPTRGKFSLKLLDNNVQSNVKNEHTVKMNKGWLLKSFEYNAESGPLPGIDSDKITLLNTTSSAEGVDGDFNILNTIINPLSLYDAVSGSIQPGVDAGVGITPGAIFGFNKSYNPNYLGEGLYGCTSDSTNINFGEGEDVCEGKDSASMAEQIRKFKEVFSYGPLYHSGSEELLGDNTQTVNDQQYNPNNEGLDKNGELKHISLGKYNQHAPGSLRFRFGVTSRVNDSADIPGFAPSNAFYPLYTGDNTIFVDNKFTRSFIKQENDSTLGVKNFNFPTINEIEFNPQSDGSVTPPFRNWIGNATINPSITASIFIGQCVQYLNSHSKDTELHLTLFEGTKDFSGNNDEMSISTFEVDKNTDPGYLDFAGNLGNLYNSAGPRSKVLKLKNSPQFRPTIQPKKYDRFTYDIIDTTDFQATIEERQNAFVYGPGTSNPYISSNAGYSSLNGGGPFVSDYDNSPGSSDNYSGSFHYQLSFLDKDHTLIADLDKNIELMDGIGAKGAVLIPEHTHQAVKINLFYYLNKAGLIDRTTVKKRIETL